VETFESDVIFLSFLRTFEGLVVDDGCFIHEYIDDYYLQVSTKMEGTE
jgi:hypothetical protein